jgi:hypothetical protein
MEIHYLVNIQGIRFSFLGIPETKPRYDAIYDADYDNITQNMRKFF